MCFFNVKAYDANFVVNNVNKRPLHPFDASLGNLFVDQFNYNSYVYVLLSHPRGGRGGTASGRSPLAVGSTDDYGNSRVIGLGYNPLKGISIS